MRIAFFASGNGSTFQQLVESIRIEALPAQPALLLCSNSKAHVLDRASNLNVDAVVISRKEFLNTSDHAEALFAALQKYSVDFICLCGYVELVPPQVVAAFRHRILNIHPALLPAFGGKGMYGHRVHEAVIEYGARLSGATVHFVDEEYDHGPILAQQAVIVLPDDTAETLAARVQNIEKTLYFGALRTVTKGKFKIVDRKVTLLP